MSMLKAIANGLKAVAAYFGWARQRDAEKNAPEMKANASKKTEARIEQKVGEATATGDKGDLSKENQLFS